MDGQRFAIGGRVYDAEDPQLQAALGLAYDAPGRPRCLCVPGGVEMYVAFHRQYQIKRMPDTGSGTIPHARATNPRLPPPGWGNWSARPWCSSTRRGWNCMWTSRGCGYPGGPA